MKRRSLLLGIAGLVVFACTKTDEPTDPVWSKEPCAHCRMLVGDKRYAGQIVTNGDRKFFDDVGCMVTWLADAKAERVWVRDALANRWLEAKSARYVEGAKTPMDFGFEARAEGGIGWDEMREAIARKGRR